MRAGGAIRVEGGAGMSVVVRMEMPKNCKTCPFRVGALCLVPGNWRERYTMPDEGRSEHCPIICSLPEGHGRLVDAEILRAKLIEHIAETNGFGNAFNETPTIVPAERRETCLD